MNTSGSEDVVSLYMRCENVLVGGYRTDFTNLGLLFSRMQNFGGWWGGGGANDRQ